MEVKIKRRKPLLLTCLLLMLCVTATAQVEQVPFASIHYTANSKLSGFECGPSTKFDGQRIISHTFSGGSGVITFEAPVLTLDATFEGCSGLTSISLPDWAYVYVVDDEGKVVQVTYSQAVFVIGDRAFAGCSHLESIYIPNSVISIENFAFEGCSGLTSVTIPNSVETIGGSAFSGCSGLTSVIIPNSVETIGGSAFEGCSGLTSVTIPNSVESIGMSAFKGCSGLTSVTIPNSVTSIGDRVFQSCSGLTSVTIPNSVTSIGRYAFYGCSGLTSVTIPNSVTSIGEYAFAYCSGLTSVTIPNSVKGIGYSAFSGCSGLTSVTIGNSVTSIGSSATFEGCSNVKELIYAEGTKTVLETGLTSITSVTIPNSVESIGASAFYGCSGLTSVTIPNSVTSIGRYAFYGCSGLTSIHVESGNKTYDSRDNCNAIINTSTNTLIAGCKNTVIPNSVTSIGQGAFRDCSGLTSVTIPNSVESIGDWAFSGCSGLTSVTIPNSVESIGRGAFYYCSGLTSVTIGNSVESIEYEAFSGCTGLTSVTIPNSVTSIGERAFYYCSGLTSVTIGNSVESIGERAFYYCSSLTSVIIPNSVTSIGTDAFAKCSSLTSVTIGNSVTSIGDWAFSSCFGLTSIVIPNSVESIGEDAFSGCSQSLRMFFPSQTPPTFGNNSSCCGKLYVPYGSKRDYISATGGYENIEEVYYRRGFAFRRTGDWRLAVVKRMRWKDDEFWTVVIPAIMEEELAQAESADTKERHTAGVRAKGDVVRYTVTSIDPEAFMGESEITDVVIPKTITEIGARAFSGCSGMRNLTVEWDTPLEVTADIFNGVSLKDVTLHVPEGTEELYSQSDVWNGFGAVVPVESNYIAVDADGTETRAFVKPSDCVTVDDALRQLTVKADIEDVSVTYTRDFSASGNWQAWFVPFDVAYDDMSRDYEVAQIQGVLTDETGKPFIAFCKMTGGVVKANTPYVVKPRLSGERVTETTSTLYRTADARSFTIQSAVSDFTFGGVYEETLCGDKGWYALNNNGGFQRMGESVYLRPFRVWMTITPREDNPYAIAESPDEVKMMVMDEATGIDLVGRVDESRGVRAVNLAGQTVGKDYKGVVIINGRKYMR